AAYTDARSCRGWLDHAHVYQVLESAKIIRVARVQRSVLCVSGGCDQQVHRASSRLTSGFYDRGRQAAVASRDYLVEGESIESALKNTQAPQAFGAHPSGLGNQDPEVQLRQRDSADGQDAGDWRDVLGNHHARVEHAPLVRCRLLGHCSVHGSRTVSSTSSRSASQSASAGPANRSVTSSQRCQRVSRAGTSLALGRPETVMRISSPPSTRRRSPEASCLSSRSPTVSMTHCSACATSSLMPHT